jgi:hypothetical protein
MTTFKFVCNPSGLTLREWLDAAGWGSFTFGQIIARDNDSSFQQLAAAWHNDQDPAEWIATAPKRVDQ